MDINVSKESEVPLRKQVFAQITFLIGTGRLKPGDSLPSVRALARRLKIHHNTVSQAYQELVSVGFLTGHRGGRLLVRFPDQPLSQSQRTDLDDLINETVKLARQQGYTLQQIRQRVRERMLEAPPDHLLVVSDQATMRELLRLELTEAQSYPVDTCSTADLAANPALAIGSLILTPPGLMPKTVTFLSKSQPAIPVLYSEATEHLQLVRQLPRPSLIAVVSIDQFFLDMSRGVLSPVVGNRHSLIEYLLTGDRTCAIGCADIVFCDSIAYRHLQTQSKAKTIVPYRLISQQCVEQVASIMTDSAAGL